MIKIYSQLLYCWCRTGGLQASGWQPKC